jgi:hypothetical protein
MPPIIGRRRMVKGMQHRGVALPHGLIFFCIASLFVLGLFVVPAGAQTDDPIAGQTAFIEDEDGDGTVDTIGPIAVADCTVDPDATIVVEDGDGTRVTLTNGQNVEITGMPEGIAIEVTVDSINREFDEGTGKVVSSTGIECEGISGNGADSGGNEADDAQYRAQDKEITVIVETIPDKKVLVDTGGPSLAMIGLLVLAVGFVGLGIFLLRWM